MSVTIPVNLVQSRPAVWKWLICGLLLLATTINYMDRLTLNLMSVKIMERFDLNAGVRSAGVGVRQCLCHWRHHHRLAGGSHERPLAVCSFGAGVVAGGLQYRPGSGFVSLLILRFLLGLAEAGNWPCALRTTQHILRPEERTMGNSILQSGASVGAILTPLIVIPLLFFPHSAAAQRLAQAVNIPLSYFADSVALAVSVDRRAWHFVGCPVAGRRPEEGS